MEHIETNEFVVKDGVVVGQQLEPATDTSNGFEIWDGGKGEDVREDVFGQLGDVPLVRCVGHGEAWSLLAMDTLESLVSLLVPRQCARSILSFDFQEIDCFKLLISKGLSLGIVVGSSVVKVPQILNILINKSVQGLSLSSLILETISIIVTVAYSFRLGNPFSTYGEGTLPC